MGCSTSKSKTGRVPSMKLDSQKVSVESLLVASMPSGLTRISKWKSRNRNAPESLKQKVEREPKKGRTLKTKGEHDRGCGIGGGGSASRSPDRKQQPAEQQVDADAAASQESLLSTSSLADERGGTPEEHDAFRKVERPAAERMLLYPNTPNGTFLVRPREQSNSYALSVRFFKFNEMKNYKEPTVKHFMLNYNAVRREYELGGLTYRSFTDLVAQLSSPQSNELGVRLAGPVRTYRSPEKFADLELSPHALRIEGKELGRGAFGTVQRGMLNGRVPVAIKSLQPGSMPVESFIEEARIMHKLTHPNIVQILGVVTRGEPTLLVSEFMELGSLNNYLKANRGALFPAFFLNAASDVAAGCEYLEEKGVVHRDLRTANVLLDENEVSKVADFGLARFREHLTDDQSSPLPMRWTAPEAGKLRKFSSKSDVFSFGVLLWELVTYGALPYMQIGNNQRAFDKVCGGHRMRNPAEEGLASWCPKSLYQLMYDCWKTNAAERPVFGDIKKRLNDLLSLEVYSQDPSADRDFASDGASGK